jgi:glycosyltransferase involved in cell wall biosynthesis
MIQARESFWPYCIKEQVVAYGTGGPIGPPESQLQIFLSMYPQLMGKRFLLFLSRIHPKKGCDILLSAFSQAAKNDPNLMLVLAGPDETGWIGELRSHAQALQIEDRLVFTGMLTGDLKWGAFHASEAFILPSHQENFGLVVAEALACSKPVLISNKVNIWREIAHAGAGLVGDDTVEGTAGMIRRWLDLSADEIYAMGSRARDLYQREFNVGASAHSLLGVLNEASAVGRGIPTRAVTETGRAVAAKLK